MAPENALWVGAWWIGFLGAGAASLLISIPILGYPQRLPGTQGILLGLGFWAGAALCSLLGSGIGAGTARCSSRPGASVHPPARV